MTVEDGRKQYLHPLLIQKPLSEKFKWYQKSNLKYHQLAIYIYYARMYNIVLICFLLFLTAKQK